MAIEVNSTNVICSKCGRAFSRRKGYFAVNYGDLYKGIGHLSVCKDCVDELYNKYLSQCNSAKDSVRQVCRKLDLYWSEKVFDLVEKKSTTQTMMTTYLSKINTITYAGKSYDDTLSEEGSLWDFSDNSQNFKKAVTDDSSNESEDDLEDIPPEVILFWGTGYDAEMYKALEQRKDYWMSRFPNKENLDIGAEAIIRQICALELDINRDRKNGRPVDKSINALNTLLGSANLKPIQQKNDDLEANIDETPLGVWAQRYEKLRPIPEVDPELKDVDNIKKYISIWFFGHLSKMLGIKNSYCRLYEETIEKMRVDHPEYDDEDDEEFFNDVLSDSSDNTD